jgi:hypothetical protein
MKNSKSKQPEMSLISLEEENALQYNSNLELLMKRTILQYLRDPNIDPKLIRKELIIIENEFNRFCKQVNEEIMKKEKIYYKKNRQSK